MGVLCRGFQLEASAAQAATAPGTGRLGGPPVAGAALCCSAPGHHGHGTSHDDRLQVAGVGVELSWCLRIELVTWRAGRSGEESLMRIWGLGHPQSAPLPVGHLPCQRATPGPALRFQLRRLAPGKLSWTPHGVGGPGTLSSSRPPVVTVPVCRLLRGATLTTRARPPFPWLATVPGAQNNSQHTRGPPTRHEAPALLCSPDGGSRPTCPRPHR